MSVAPVTIERLQAGVFPAMALLAGMRLDVFSSLSGGPRSTEEVAGAIAVAPARLQPLLRVLHHAGLLRSQDGRWTNSDEAERYLVASSDFYLGAQWHMLGDLWRSLLNTADSISTGRPTAVHRFGEGDEAAFFRGMHPGAVAAGRVFPDHFDAGEARSVVDLGAGSGGFALGLAARWPQRRIIAVDLPQIATLMREFIDEDAAVEVLGHDMTAAPLPEAADLIVMRFLLQCLGPREAEAVVHNAVASLAAGGRIAIIGRMLEDDLGPAPAANYGLIALNQYASGDTYPERRYRDWLRAAGCGAVERLGYLGGATLLVAGR
jgi:SAM-dependent methyltransferase